MFGYDECYQFIIAAVRMTATEHSSPYDNEPATNHARRWWIIHALEAHTQRTYSTHLTVLHLQPLFLGWVCARGISHKIKTLAALFLMSALGVGCGSFLLTRRSLSERCIMVMHAGRGADHFHTHLCALENWYQITGWNAYAKGEWASIKVLRVYKLENP